MVGPRSHGPRCRSTRPGITLLGRPLAANGRCSDGMSTPAARRDQDAQSARRLGYVNTCRLKLTKPIPTGIQNLRPKAGRPRARQKGPRPEGATTTGPGGHPNRSNLEALNMHRNKTSGHPTNKIPKIDPARESQASSAKKLVADSSSLPASPTNFSTPRTFHVLHPMPTQSIRLPLPRLRQVSLTHH